MSETFNPFKIDIDISRAYEDEKGRWIFEGIASSTAIDSHNTIFSASCQEGFVFDIDDANRNGEPIELEAEHLGDDLPFNIVGDVDSATFEDNKLKVRCEFDKDNPQAQFYWLKMTKPNKKTGKVKRYGLSIHGNVVDAAWEFNSEIGKSLQVFHRVKLKRVGIVRKPSNPESWIGKMLRSVNWDAIKMDEVKRSDQSSGGLVVSVVSKGDDVQQKSEKEIKLELLERVERGENIFTEDVAKNLQDWLLSLAANLSSYPKASQEEALMEEIESKMISEIIEDKMEEESEEERGMDTANMAGSIGESLSDEIEYVNDEDFFRACGAKKIRFAVDDEFVDIGWDSAMNICREWVKMSKTKNMQRSEEQEMQDNLTEVVESEVAVADDVVKEDPVVRSESDEVVPEVESTEVAESVEDAVEVERAEEIAVEPLADEVVAEEVEKRSESADQSQFDSALIELMRSAIATSVAESLAPQIAGLQEEIKALRSENKELSEKNDSLLTRMAAIEGQPVSTPGFLGQTIERSEQVTKEQLRAEAIRRAKETGNKVEAVRLLTDPNYCGS